MTLLQWKHTCGCVPSRPCGSCSGCSGLCSSRSESPGSRPSDLACACERACSSASRSHSVPSSPLQDRSVRISFNTHKAYMRLNATCKRLEGEVEEECLPTLYNTPGVEAAAHPLPFGLHHSVAANDCKRNAFLMGGQKESANQNCLAGGGWRLCKRCFFLTAIFSFALISARVQF